MATNWQPSFGLPFPPFPPPQPTPQQQPQAQPDAQSGPSDAYPPPPPASTFVPPPAWNIPGLNIQAHNQNAQQPQFPSAWPPNFPMPDQLAQWNQMQMDMQQLPFMMMQNAPPIPGLALASNPPPQSPFQSATPTHPFPTLPPNHLFPAPAQMYLVPQSVQNDRITDMTESDKEEGEVSEGSRSPAVNGRTYPDPPRSVPLNSSRSSNNPQAIQQEVYNPDQPAAGQTSEAALRTRTAAPAKTTADNISQQRSDAKAFIKLLQNNNIGYHALAAEALDASSLRDLYRSLNLPSEPEPMPSPPKVNGNAQTFPSNGDNVGSRTSPPTTSSKPVTAVNTSVPPTKSAPSPANRKEYLAQLQAAKKARQQGGAKLTPPQNTPPPAPAASKAVSAPQVAGTGENGQLTEAEKKAKTTELIRRRIEALKKNSSSPAGAASSKITATGSTTATSSGPLPATVNTLPPTVNDFQSRAVPPSPFGNIPGLFMNSSPVVQPSQPPVTPGSSKRKRSVPSNNSPLQGNEQNAHGMQFDDRQDVVAIPPTQVISPSPLQNGLQGVRAMPALPGFPLRPASVNPPVSALSTPGPQTPSSSTRSQEMDDKARKQAALKERLQKKIEEQKRQAEQNRLASAQSSPKPLPQQSPSLPKLSVGRGTSREPKKRRKVDIEAEQSALDIDIAANAAKLAQITKEFELLTANDRKMRYDKERLQAELESLGIDTEGMPHAELQAKKDEIEREQGMALRTLAASTNIPATSPTMKQLAGATVPAPAATVLKSGGVTQALSQPPEVSQPVIQTGIPGLNAPFPLASSPPTIAKPHGAIKQQTSLPHSTRDQADRPEKSIPSKPPVIASVHDAVSNDLSKPATPLDDEEDFYSPEPAAVIPAGDQIEPAPTSSARAKSPSEEGEMAMSESDEEDYEPEEAQEPLSHDQVPIDKTTEQDTTVATSRAPSSASPSVYMPTNEDEDPYEPPDVDQPMMHIDPGHASVEPQPNDQQGEVEEGEMDMSTSSGDDSDSDTSSESSAEEPNEPALASSSKNPGSSVTVADDLAPELQPDASAVALVSQDPTGPSTTQESHAEEVETNPRSFVPYESPLRLFKSYRYHPTFAQDISSGFLSMTFSHQIDPEKPLCETEALGFECVDAGCPKQHFRDMNISGEKLLVQLGTANPGKTPEERQRWNDGLRGVLKDLRQKNTKDPNGIAIEIANYRRQFLQDDTRVVNL
ncbi:uncharacterized protein N0V89_004709 [Didymosphaeria variabile]|uniref:Zinc-finger domain-containing protein n=1 Tax=Didymosphaeria variabile TaxID=1932322 RepID=A0A9W8XSP4_9PLEO|nr:uncharacterized protein N0V89_004709 [Didymosphaeria variabile]KAJ4356673.1 hypothetical protein N0V89_004709 [Didymosphaeria variabile]